MKISAREGVLLALCVVVVAVIGVPSAQQILRMAKSPKSPAQLRKESEIARREAARLRREIADLDQQVQTLTWVQAPEQLPPVLLTELHRLANKAGVTIGSFRPSRIVASPAGRKLPILVKITAPFPKAAAFLEALRSGDPRIGIERMQIAATDAASNVVNMELRLAVYSAAQQAQQGKAIGADANR